MSRAIEKPKVSVDEGCLKGERLTHPAFGTITLTNTSGGNSQLFGSDVKNFGHLRIEIKAAELNRSLSRDWIHGRQTLVEIALTHAQFAEFITGVGRGEGTPVTLLYGPTPDSKMISIPGIAPIESRMDTFKKEVKEMSRNHIESLQKQVKELGEALTGSSLSKKQLQALHKGISKTLDVLPGNMEFVVSSAEEALEKNVTNAKIEVEAFISSHAKRIGVERLQDIAEVSGTTKAVELLEKKP